MENLERPFGLWTATAMVVGGMIGAGIFVLPGALAPVGWASVASWVVAGAGVLAIALVIVRLMSERPEEPSIVTLCGDILGLLPGRMMAWIYWVTIVCSVPVLSMAATAYLLHLFPALPAGPWPRALGGTAIVALLAATNLRGVREAGYLQVATTALKLVPLLLVIAIGAWLLGSAPQTYAQSPAEPFALANLTPALGITFFAMLSFENAGMLAQRVRDPARNVARATLLGIALVLVVYFLVSSAIVLALPADELRANAAPVAYFVGSQVGPLAGGAVALFAAISAIGCLNVLVMLLGELPLGLVRDGQLPAAMAPTNAHKVAARPLVLGCVLGVALMLASVSSLGEQVLDFLLRLTTASAIWFYLSICLAALLARTRQALALLGLGFCLWVLYGTGLEAGLLSLLLLAVGVPLHWLIGQRTRPRNTVPAG